MRRNRNLLPSSHALDVIEHIVVQKLCMQGHCLLFSTGEWREKDGQFVVHWANQA
jgi:hypothetical protein